MFYFFRFLSAENYSNERQLHAEEFAFEYLQSAKLNVIEIPLRFQRIRALGE